MASEPGSAGNVLPSRAFSVSDYTSLMSGGALGTAPTPKPPAPKPAPKPTEKTKSTGTSSGGPQSKGIALQHIATLLSYMIMFPVFNPHSAYLSQFV